MDANADVEEKKNEAVSEGEEEVKTEIRYCKEHGAVEAIYKGGRWRCPKCGRLVRKEPYPEEEKKEKEEEEEEDLDLLLEDEDWELEEEEEWDYSDLFEEEEEEVAEKAEKKEEKKEKHIAKVLPPEVEFEKKALIFLRRELPKVYGITRQRLAVIIEYLRQNPHILHDPMSLYTTIRWLCRGANVDDTMLSLKINALYRKLGHLLQDQGVTVPPIIPGPSATSTPAPVPPMFNPYHHNVTTPGFNPAIAPVTQVPAAQTQVTKKKRTFKIVIDGQVIETDDPQEYIALKRWQQEQKEWVLRMKKLEEEIKSINKKKEEEEKEESKTSTESKIVETLKSDIDYLRSKLDKLTEEKEKLEKQLEEERKKREQERVQKLEEELKQLREFVNNPFKILQIYEDTLAQFGYTRQKKSVLDVLDEAGNRAYRLAETFLMKLPGPVPRNPPVMTEEQKMREMDKIEKMLDKAKDTLEVENKLIQAARQYYGKQSHQ